MAYKDSLGNSYDSLPKAPPVHKAKPTSNGSMRRHSRRNNGQKVNKHARYRAQVGKPNGPGIGGNKSGHNKD